MINNKYKIEIIDNLIDIKNYKEILDYSSKYISINLNNKIINIVGSNLLINKMDEYELTIIGNINNIEFKYE